MMLALVKEVGLFTQAPLGIEKTACARAFTVSTASLEVTLPQLLVTTTE